jgi:hypothetical protein
VENDAKHGGVNYDTVQARDEFNNRLAGSLIPQFGNQQEMTRQLGDQHLRALLQELDQAQRTVAAKAEAAALKWLQLTVEYAERDFWCCGKPKQKMATCGNVSPCSKASAARKIRVGPAHSGCGIAALRTSCHWH